MFLINSRESSIATTTNRCPLSRLAALPAHPHKMGLHVVISLDQCLPGLRLLVAARLALEGVWAVEVFNSQLFAYFRDEHT